MQLFHSNQYEDLQISEQICSYVLNIQYYASTVTSDQLILWVMQSIFTSRPSVYVSTFHIIPPNKAHLILDKSS